MKQKEGKTNPYIPKHLRERQLPIEERAIETSMEKLRQLGGSYKNGESHKSDKNGKDGENGKKK